MTDYQPKPGSLAEQVVSYFRLHPHDTMTIDDVIETFRPKGTKGNVQLALEKAIDAKLLLWRGSLLMAGPELDAQTQTQRPPTAEALAAASPFAAVKPKKNGLSRGERRGHVAALDIDALQVDEGVPMPTAKQARESRWTALLDKLHAPGTSIKIPRECNASLGVWIRKIKKTRPEDKRAFRVGLDLDGVNRVWRTA